MSGCCMETISIATCNWPRLKKTTSTDLWAAGRHRFAPCEEPCFAPVWSALATRSMTVYSWLLPVKEKNSGFLWCPALQMCMFRFIPKWIYAHHSLWQDTEPPSRLSERVDQWDDTARSPWWGHYRSQEKQIQKDFKMILQSITEK